MVTRGYAMKVELMNTIRKVLQKLKRDTNANKYAELKKALPEYIEGYKAALTDALQEIQKIK
jgi:hypothetical protein